MPIIAGQPEEGEDPEGGEPGVGGFEGRGGSREHRPLGLVGGLPSCGEAVLGVAVEGGEDDARAVPRITAVVAPKRAQGSATTLVMRRWRATRPPSR